MEKHGALWANGEPTVFEQFDKARQYLGVVFKRGGLFAAVIYEMCADPQWRLPCWGKLQPDALFDSQVEAVTFVQSCLSTEVSG